MEPTFVRFMSPECKYCVESQSEWERFTKLGNLPVKAVEIGRNEKIFKYNGKEYSYSAVPTYMFFNGDNEPKEYKGSEKTAEAWLSFVNSNLKKGGKRRNSSRRKRRRSRGRRGLSRTRAVRSSF